MTEEQKSWYLDPRWQRYRLNRLKAADWKCEQCGDSKSTFHIHHTFYRAGRKPWQYPFCTTRVLCEQCHKAEHGDVDESKVRAFVKKAEDFHRTFEMRRELEEHPEDARMEEWVFFENGQWITVKRPTIP